MAFNGVKTVSTGLIRMAWFWPEKVATKKSIVYPTFKIDDVWDQKFPKKKSVLKVAHFWEFGWTQNAPLFDQTVYVGNFLRPICEKIMIIKKFLGNNILEL